MVARQTKRAVPSSVTAGYAHTRPTNSWRATMKRKSALDKKSRLSLVKRTINTTDINGQNALHQPVAGHVLTWLKKAWEFPAKGTFYKDPDKVMDDAGRRYVIRWLLTPCLITASSLPFFLLCNQKQAVIAFLVNGFFWTYFYFIRWCQRN